MVTVVGIVFTATLRPGKVTLGRVIVNISAALSVILLSIIPISKQERFTFVVNISSKEFESGMV